MAIIKVTQKTFSKILLDKIDDMGMTGLLMSEFLGGKEKMKEAIADDPDEKHLWINTDHVVAVSLPIKVSETGDVVFRIHFAHPDRKDDAIWIKGEDYTRFILTWAGEIKSNTGVEDLELLDGYRATAYDDGRKIKIEKIKED